MVSDIICLDVRMPKRSKPVDPALLGFPARLRQAREESGLGVRELGDASGVGVAAVSRYENAKNYAGVSAASILALAKALGVRASWLLTGDLPMRADGKFVVIEMTPQLLEMMRQSTGEVQTAVARRR